MRTVAGIVAGFGLACLLAVAIPALAQDKEASPGQHPLVGTWIVTVNIGFGNSTTAIFSFHDDGTAIAADSDGRAWPGAWAATGPRSGTYQFAGPVDNTTGDLGVTFYGTAEVDATGNTFIRSFEMQSGGGDIKGQRMVVSS